MRIAYMLINSNLREGTSRAVLEVARRLAEHHDVSVFSRSVDNIDFGRINLQLLPGPSWPDVAEFECYRRNAEKTLKRKNFDIIHSAGCNVAHADVFGIHTIHPAKLNAVDNREKNKNVSMPQRLTRFLYDRFVIRAEKASYKSIGSRGIIGYVPVSSGASQELQKHYPVKEAIIEVIPNAADTELFNPRNRIEYGIAIRKEFDLKSENFVVLFAGGEWPRKGLANSLRAIARVNAPHINLLIAGDDPRREEFKEMAAQLGIADKVRWAGFRRDIHKFYGAADLFLIPSKYEAFCVATIEAAACGLPVVMTNISGASELLGDGNGGEIVDDEPDAIARAIERFAVDENVYRRASVSARSKAESRFTWDVVSRSTELFYEKLLSHRSDMARSYDQHKIV